MFFTLQNNINVDNTLTINYMNETITNVPSVKFLGLLVDETLNLDKHISQIASKLITASYAVRTLTPLLSLNALKMLYFSYAP